MPRLNDNHLKKIEKLISAATPGPWAWFKFVPKDKSHTGFERNMPGLYSLSEGKFVCDFGDDTEFYPEPGKPPSDDDKEFIECARTYVPLLLDDLREAREEIDRLRAENERLMADLRRKDERIARLQAVVRAIELCTDIARGRG